MKCSENIYKIGGFLSSIGIFVSLYGIYIQANNITRKQKKLAAKKKEQEAAMAPEVKKKSLALASMRAMVNQANKALKNNENKVSYLEAEAKQHQIELKKAQEDKAAEKHRRLQARLEKKKQAKMGAKK